MPEPINRPERIDLARIDDPRDVVHQAVACLAQGGVVSLKTGSVPVVAACALHPAAVARLGNHLPTSRSTILLRDEDEAEDWSPEVDATARKLGRRGWPGPLTLVFPVRGRPGLADRLPEEVRRAITGEGDIALRVSDDGILREIVRLAPGPIISREGEPTVTDLEMIIESASVATNRSSTVVRVEASGWTILREGAYSRDEVAAMAGTLWLFVCTGNTCRSPMAEALCKVLLCKRLALAPDRLADRGYVVMSAGVGASRGMPAAAHAAEIVAARGGSLKTHASRRADRALLLKADLVIALAGDHLDTILEIAPEVSGRARLLHREGHDIADPIGSDRAVYRETAREIEAEIEAMLDDLGL